MRLAALLGVIPKARRHGLRLLVTPDTLVHWNRDIIQRRRAARSVRGKTGRPATRQTVKALALRLARENPEWGYRRIHGTERATLLVRGVDAILGTHRRQGPGSPGERRHDQVGRAMGYAEGRMGIEAQIEDASGLAGVERIAAASPRLGALVFGPAGFMASPGMRSLAIGAQPQGTKTLLSERGYDPVLGARPLRRTIQREIEDHLSEKILFGELKAGQIVMVDAEGSGTEGKFSFKGVAKPDAVPDAPPAEIASESKAPASGADGRLTNGQ